MKIEDLFEPFEDELQLLATPRVPNPPAIEWRSGFGDFFFRPKGANPQLLWCDLGYSITPKRPLPVPRPTTLAKRVSKAYGGRSFFRVVPFEDADDWLLIRPKRGVVKSPHQPMAALWKWNCAFEGKQTQIEWLSQDQGWFENYLRDAKDDLPLQMARDCAALGEEERQWKLEATPTVKQWEQLVRALFVLATPASVSSISWGMSRPDGCEGVLMPQCYAYLSGATRPVLSSQAVALLHLLQENTRLPFWRSLDARGQHVRAQFPGWRFNEITHHERLEAGHLWQDFGRRIGKSSEVEASLRELMG